MNFPNLPLRSSIGPIYREFLYRIVMLGLHKNILEVGCCQGYSTSAFIAALRDGADFSLSLCDVQFTESLRNVVADCPVKFYEQQSKDTINSSYDLIFVDSDHTIATVAEEIKLLIAHRVKTVLFHDTHLMRDTHFWGAVLAKGIFDVHPSYYGFTLHNAKEGFLNLGFSVYTRDKDIYESMLQLAKENAEGRELSYNVYPNPNNDDKSSWDKVRHERPTWDNEPKFGIDTTINSTKKFL